MTNSVKQKAYQTPFAPANRLNKYAAGIITATYRSSERNRALYDNDMLDAIDELAKE